MTGPDGYPLHRGLMLGGLRCAAPLFGFLFGPEGAAHVLTVSRDYAADPGDPEVALERLDDVGSVVAEVDVDAAGFLDFLLPDQPASHTRWVAFFYGQCRSSHHAPIEAAVIDETGAKTLDEALTPWCPAETAGALCAAIDASERAVAEGRLDDFDQRLISEMLAPNVIYDVTHPIYSQIMDLMRMSHLNSLFARLPDAVRAEVVGRVKEAAA